MYTVCLILFAKYAKRDYSGKNLPKSITLKIDLLWYLYSEIIIIKN